MTTSLRLKGAGDIERARYAQMPISQLRKEAVRVGVGEDAIDAGLDDMEDPKAALIELVLAAVSADAHLAAAATSLTVSGEGTVPPMTPASIPAWT